MKSFSYRTKEEISHLEFIEEKSELSSLIRSMGTFVHNQNQITLSLKTENPTIIKRLYILIRKYYDVIIEKRILQNNQLKKQKIYQLEIFQTEELINDLEIVEPGLFMKVKPTSEKFISTNKQKKIFLRGAFLGSGTISDPKNGQYRLEIISWNDIYAEDIIKIINYFNLNCRKINRKNKIVIYMTKGEDIEDFLKIINANNALFELADFRINKDMNNAANRLENFDIANASKIMNAADEQIKMMDEIIYSSLFENLSEKDLDIINIRQDNPELSLQEIADLSEGKYTKSSVNHTMRKIKKLYEILNKGN